MIKSLAWVAASVFVGGGTVAAITVSHNAGFKPNPHAVINTGQRSANSAEHGPQFGAWGQPGALNVMGMLANSVAAALHISPATVQQELSSGQTLTQIAQHAGSSPATLRAALLQDAQAEIHKAVSVGLFTSSQASRLDSHLNAWANQMMTQNPLQWQRLMSQQGAQIMRGMFVNDVSSALHMSPATVKADMAAHEGLAQIAKNAGSSTTTLESALAQDARTQIQKGVSIGVLTSPQAKVLDGHINGAINHIVTQNPGQWQHSSHSWKAQGPMGLVLQKAAQSLHMSVSTLKTDLGSGETPAQIAKNAGSSPAALESTLLNDAKTQLRNAVSSGLLNSTQASRLESHMSVMIDHWVMASGSNKGPSGFAMPGLPMV